MKRLRTVEELREVDDAMIPAHACVSLHRLRLRNLHSLPLLPLQWSLGIDRDCVLVAAQDHALEVPLDPREHGAQLQRGKNHAQLDLRDALREQQFRSTN